AQPGVRCVGQRRGLLGARRRLPDGDAAGLALPAAAAGGADAGLSRPGAPVAIGAITVVSRRRMRTMWAQWGAIWSTIKQTVLALPLLTLAPIGADQALVYHRPAVPIAAVPG